MDFKEEPHSQAVNLGSSVTLKCSANTNGPVQILWKHNGHYVDPSPLTGFSIVNGNLHIKSFRHRHGEESEGHSSESHRGEYQCVLNSTSGTLVSRPAILEKAGMSTSSAPC